MSFIQPADPETLSDQACRAYDRQEKAFGYLPNYATLFGYRPDVIDRWAELQRALRTHVSPRLFELVTFAAALELGSSYCALAHGSRLRDFLVDTEICALASGEYEGVVSPYEAAAMRYARRLVGNSSGVTAEDIDELRAVGYTDPEIFDIAGVAAGRAFFANLVEGLGAGPDSVYRNLPTHLQDVLVVGRQIAAEVYEG